MQREAFLNSIASRLGRARAHSAPARSVSGVPERYRSAPFGRGSESNLTAVFQAEIVKVGAEISIVTSLAEAHLALAAFLDGWPATRVVTWARQEFAGWDLDWLWEQRRARAWLDDSLVQRSELYGELMCAEVGVTVVDCAVANTGSLVVSASPGRPRGVSLLPTVHVALVRSSQIVARLGEALAAYVPPASVPSAVHVITGPSRTSDIENDLTIGVHGPAAVSVLVLDDMPT